MPQFNFTVNNLQTMGVAKRVCKIGRWNVQTAKRRDNNTRMARRKQEVSDIVAIIVGAVTHLRKKSKAMKKPFVRKPSKCISMEQAWDALDDTWVSITRRWRIGQRRRQKNYPTHLCLLKLEPQNLTRSSPILAIKKPHLSHYTCW